MVDKENQWDDIEYSEDEEQEYGDSEYSDSEYSDSDYSDNQEYDDGYDDEDDEEGTVPAKKKSNQLPLLIIALLLFGIAGFIMISKMGGNKNVTADAGSVSDQSAIEQVSENSSGEQSQQDMGDMFFEQAGGDSSDMMSVNFNENDGAAQVTTNNENGDEIVATVKESEGTPEANQDIFESNTGDISSDTSKENNDIVISYDKPANSNPFKPPVRQVEKSVQVDNEALVNNTPFEIIEPPTASVPDENLTKLLQTQISGILYDTVSPSAIVNLNGVDSFVKVGDTIAGYTIQAITEDKVQISYKNNSYVASVGELFTKGSLEKQSAVANLEKKFAGRYK